MALSQFLNVWMEASLGLRNLRVPGLRPAPQDDVNRSIVELGTKGKAPACGLTRLSESRALIHKVMNTRGRATT